MSSKRVVLSSVVMAMVMLAGSWYAVGAFPLTGSSAQAQEVLSAPGPLEKQAKPITPENPIPRRISHAVPDVPVEADAIGLTGSVNYRITLDEFGRVAEVRRSALSVTAPDMGLSARNVAAPLLDSFIDRGVPEATRQRVTSAIAAMERAAFEAVRQWRYDPPYEAPISFPVTIPVGAAQIPPPPPPAPTALGGAEGALRVGGNIKAPTKIRDVRPEYPEIARAARVAGVVILEVLIGRDGTVQDAKVLRSIPLLDDAALEAVKQWQFTPTLMNGVPIPVIMTVTVNFTVQ